MNEPEQQITNTGLAPEGLLNIYRTMTLVRVFDNKVSDLCKEGHPLVHHPSLGQEAPIVTACAMLNQDDVIMPYHRGWAWAIGKGMSPARILAELFGKRTGYGNGKSGPHLADWDLGVLGRSGTQGAHLQIAAGVGLALRLERKRRVCLAFFGEGASNTGAFHEGLNLAAVWDAPVVYICESNNYQSGTPFELVMRINSVAERASSYGMPGVTVDGNDVMDIYKSVSQAIERARNGAGPSLIDCKTYLVGENYFLPEGTGPKRGSAEEVAAWREKCPIQRLRLNLIQAGLLNESQCRDIDAEMENLVNDAVQFALKSPYPSREELAEDIYAP